jgi:hypothetical protein
MPTDHPEFVHPSVQGAAERLLADFAASLERSGGRAVVGPWLGEVGFEVLYWIPFLHWLSERYGLGPENVTVVSRGGVADWYFGFCEHYVDVFDAVEPEEFRSATLELWRQTGGLQKQVHVREWDERVLDLTVGEEWRSAALVHPQLLYRLFRNVWQAALPLRDFLDRAVHRPWVEPTLDLDLPEEFTAVRFYFRPSFPDTPGNREVVRDVVERLAARRPVVLLNTGIVVDDHLDAEPAETPNVFRPLAGISAARNLGVQSAVVARSKLFVGTYGGLAHLAPFHRVPTIGFASAPVEINPVHLTLARRTASIYEAPLAVVQPTAIELLAA